MPKPLTIIVHVEEVAFGKVWRVLDKMPGVTQLELRSEGKGSKPANGDARSDWRKPGGFNLREAILAHMAKGGGREVLHVDAMREMAVANGRVPGGVASVTSSLSRRKLIKHGKTRGLWEITPKGKEHAAQQQKAAQ